MYLRIYCKTILDTYNNSFYLYLLAVKLALSTCGSVGGNWTGRSWDCHRAESGGRAKAFNVYLPSKSSGTTTKTIYTYLLEAASQGYRAWRQDRARCGAGGDVIAPGPVADKGFSSCNIVTATSILFIVEENRKITRPVTSIAVRKTGDNAWR